MTPESALERQIERYRQMSGEERLSLALRLHEMSCEITRSIRNQYPGASAVEVEAQTSCPAETGHIADDRAGTIGRHAPAAGRQRLIRHRLHADRVDGEQLLGHTSHDSRSRFRHTTAVGCYSQILSKPSKDGFALDEDSVRAAYRPPHQFNAIDERSALKVDFWLLKPDPFERLMFSRRVKHTLFGVQAWLATPEDVILHKLVWNRISPSDRQLGDCAGILAVQAGELDLDYMKQQADELQLREDLERLLSGEIRPKST